LPVELGYGGLGNFHVASSLGGFIGHIVPSASEYISEGFALISSKRGRR
jgi:hypothetical protein